MLKDLLISAMTLRLGGNLCTGNANPQLDDDGEICLYLYNDSGAALYVHSTPAEIEAFANLLLGAVKPFLAPAQNAAAEAILARADRLTVTDRAALHRSLTECGWKFIAAEDLRLYKDPTPGGLWYSLDAAAQILDQRIAEATAKAPPSEPDDAAKIALLGRAGWIVRHGRWHRPQGGASFTLRDAFDIHRQRCAE